MRSIDLPVLASPAPPAKPEIRASRTSRWRAASLIALNLLMAAHILQWWLTGRTVSPIEPSEAMYTLQRGAINAGLIFFSLAILSTLLLGRFVCGWGCHIVALQDLCAWLLKKIGLKPRPFRSRLLVWVPLVAALYMFVWPSVARYFTKPAGEPLIPQFTNHIVTTDFWATFPPVWVAVPFLFVCGFVTVYFLGSKGFCTYGCPYGGFFGVADKVAPGRIRVKQDACHQCGHCTAVCTSNVLVHLEVKQHGMVVDPGCMKCMDCVSVCPNDALYFGFGKPAVGISDLGSRISDSARKVGDHVQASKSSSNPRSAIRNSQSTNPQLNWSEEIFVAVVFAASFFAVWDVYQLVPMLMALGIAPVTTFLAFKTWRLLRSGDQSFYKFILKSGGRITNAGWTFLSFAVLWIGLTAHSGWVRYHESAGTSRFESIRIADELALAQADPKVWLSPQDREVVREGRRHLNAAIGGGLFTNYHALPKLAWLEFLGGDAERAVEVLARAAEQQSGQERAISLYYRGAILNRLGRPADAIDALDAALEDAPDLILAREELGESLWRLGRRDEAVAAWNDAVALNPRLAIANNFLAGATAGDAGSSARYRAAAAEATPDDALFVWVVGLRLRNVGMNDLAEKHFARAIQLNPEFKRARELDLINRR
ncbi:MAG: tetratricopeptide repeat protein [Pyrinomonadaceae bacterium]